MNEEMTEEEVRVEEEEEETGVTEVVAETQAYEEEVPVMVEEEGQEGVEVSKEVLEAAEAIIDVEDHEVEVGEEDKEDSRLVEKEEEEELAESSPLTSPSTSAVFSPNYHPTTPSQHVMGTPSVAEQQHYNDTFASTPQVYYDVPTSTLVSEPEISAHLVINSLIVLGFNSDDYIDIYSGIAFDLPVLTAHTFDKPNQKLLFIILHYLLTILDREDFPASIAECWPFLDQKERNAFMKAINDCLTKLLQDSSHFKHSISAIVASAKGEEVWELLRLLTDRCMDVMISIYQPNSCNDQLEASYNHGQSPLMYSRGNDDVEDSRNRILTEIDSLVTELRGMILDFNDEQNDWSSYINELDKRLDIANKRILKGENTLHEMRLLDEHHILSPAGEVKRNRVIQRINNQKELLEGFLHSPLLATVGKYITEESQNNELLESIKERLAKVNSKTRHVLMSQEELEEYKANMRTAITLLIAKIDDVVEVL